MFYINFINKILILILILHVLGCLWFGIFMIDKTDTQYLLLSPLNMLDQYIYSVYFTATHVFTIGFGDISCTCTTTRIFFIFLTFVTIIIYGYIMADLTSIFNEYFDQQNTEIMKREKFFF